MYMKTGSPTLPLLCRKASPNNMSSHARERRDIITSVGEEVDREGVLVRPDSVAEECVWPSAPFL